MAKDLMFQEEIKGSVRRAYSAITTGGGEAVARRFYTDDELAEFPAGAVGWSLSVGNPVRYAFLRQGETVLDVGSGGGIDTILAARRVGPEGRVVGLDILEEMCERGRRHAAEAGVEGWTEFVRGEMTDQQSSIPCSEAVRQLWNYLDHAISAADQERVEKHLSFCRTCCGELEFAKELRSFLASNEVEEIPPDVKAHLERFVQEL